MTLKLRDLVRDFAKFPSYPLENLVEAPGIETGYEIPGSTSADKAHSDSNGKTDVFGSANADATPVSASDVSVSRKIVSSGSGAVEIALAAIDAGDVGCARNVLDAIRQALRGKGEEESE